MFIVGMFCKSTKNNIIGNKQTNISINIVISRLNPCFEAWASFVQLSFGKRKLISKPKPEHIIKYITLNKIIRTLVKIFNCIKQQKPISPTNKHGKLSKILNMILLVAISPNLTGMLFRFKNLVPSIEIETDVVGAMPMQSGIVKTSKATKIETEIGS